MADEQSAAAPILKFNGRDYPLVQVGDFTMDEALILWEYAKIGPDKVAEVDGFHPGVVMAVIHVAVARVDSSTSAQIRRAIGKMPMTQIEEVFADISVEVKEDDSVPPTSALGDENLPVSPSADSGMAPAAAEGSSDIGAPRPALAVANGSGDPSSVTPTSDQAFAHATSAA